MIAIMLLTEAERGELIQRWHERLPVHGHEACRLDHRTTIHVGGLAQDTNLRLDSGEQSAPSPISTQTALELVASSLRAPREVQYAHVTEKECRRPLLVMKTEGGRLYLLDGACRAIQARRCGITQQQAVFVDERKARDLTIKPDGALGTEQHASQNREDRALERIGQATLFRESELLSSYAGGRARTEHAIGPVKGFDDRIEDDRFYAFPQTFDFGRDVGDDQSRAGNAPLSNVSAACRAAMVRVLMSWKALLAATGKHLSREDFLRLVLPVNPNRDETFSKEAAEQAATFVPESVRSVVSVGLQLLPNVKSLLRLWDRPEHRQWSDPDRLTVNLPRALDGERVGPADLMMHVMIENYITLAVLAIIDSRSTIKAREAKHLIRSAERKAQLHQSDFRGNALGHPSNFPRGACPPIALLLKGSSASGVNAASLWADVQRFLSVCEWAAILGRIERAETAQLHPMAGEAFVAAETLQTVFGQRNAYSLAWDSVRSLAKNARLERSMLTQSLAAARSGHDRPLKGDT
jgi:hypothetical protein